jgi:hypothetical protein
MEGIVPVQGSGFKVQGSRLGVEKTLSAMWRCLGFARHDRMRHGAVIPSLPRDLKSFCPTKSRKIRGKKA